MLTEDLVQKWQPVLEHPELSVILRMLIRGRSQPSFSKTRRRLHARPAFGSGGYQSPTLLGEAAPSNAMGASSSTASDGSVDIFDPVLISLVRRSMPNMVAYDVCGVQPMTGPTGLIFAMRSRFNSSDPEPKHLHDEANTSHSATAGQLLLTPPTLAGVIDGSAGGLQSR